MKPLTYTAAALAAGILALALARVVAEDPASPDKWQQINDNHKKMDQALEIIEQNLNFIKARSMSGGRKT
jgi:predicted nicotinamide N-methyase